MSRYLVTGGAGFIGSNIVETLLKKGIPKGVSRNTRCWLPGYILDRLRVGVEK